MMRFLAVILVGCFLSACGFQPLYGSANQGVVAELQNIALAPPQDRLNQQMYNQLSDLIHPLGSSATETYQLNYALSEDSRGFGFTQSGAVARERYTLTTDFMLLDISSGETVYRDRVTTGTTFDVVQSDFATMTAREDAQRRAVANAANAVVLKLGIYFQESMEE